MEGKREPLLAENLGDKQVISEPLFAASLTVLLSLSLCYNYFYFLPTRKEGQMKILFCTCDPRMPPIFTLQ